MVLLERLWPAMLAAAALGLAFAALGGPGRGLPSSRPAAWFAALGALVLCAIAAVVGLVPGRAGLWLDIGLLLATPYGLGVLVGAVSRQAVKSRRRTASGLPLVETTGWTADSSMSFRGGEAEPGTHRR